MGLNNLQDLRNCTKLGSQCLHEKKLKKIGKDEIFADLIGFSIKPVKLALRNRNKQVKIYQVVKFELMKINYSRVRF